MSVDSENDMSLENPNIDVLGRRPDFGKKPYEAGIFGGGGKPKFESTWKNLEDKNDRKRQEAEDQRRKLGEQAASIKDSKGQSVVDFAQDTLASTFANEGGEVFDNLRARAAQFEIKTRELYPEYKKAGNMHHDRGQEKDGIAARVFIEEAKFLRDQQNKLAGSKAPDRAVAWYPRPNRFYLDPDFIDTGLDDNPSDNFVFAAPTPASSPHTPPFTVSPDTKPNQRVNSQYDYIRDSIDSLTPEALGVVQASLMESLKDPTRPDRDEIMQLIIALGERAKQSRGGAGVSAGPGLSAEDIAAGVKKGYSEFAKEQKLQSKAYREFLSTEEWNKSLTPILGDDKKTDYWDSMSETEQRLHNIRRELNNLAYQKRTQGVVDFETYGKVPEVHTIQTKEIRYLCEQMPGFEAGLQEYANIFINSEHQDQDGSYPNKVIVDRYNPKTGRYDQEQISIRNAQSEEEDTAFRAEVRARILRSLDTRRDQTRGELLAKGVPPTQIDQVVNQRLTQIALEAELVAFNTLYSTNAFESWVEVWEEKDGGFLYDTEKYGHFIAGRFTNPALMESLYPLVTAINKGKGKNGGEVHEGKHHGWVTAQMQRLKQQYGDSEGKLKYSRIQTVDTDNKGEAERTYWTLRNGTLYVPEVYLHKVIDSPWERYTAGGQNLTSSLLTRTPINWSDLRNKEGRYEDQFTGNYSRDAKKAQVISNANLVGLQEPKRDDPTPPELTLSKALEKFPEYRKLSRLRYIFTRHIYPDDKIPYMAGEYQDKKIEAFTVHDKTTEKGIEFFSFDTRDNSRTNLFWPWDNVDKKRI